MGSRVSRIDSTDTQFYLLNIPYLDFFIIYSIFILEPEEGHEISLSMIKKRYEAKHKRCPSSSLWSQSTSRLSRRGILLTVRSSGLTVQISSPFVRAQLKALFMEMKKTEETLQKAMQIKQKFEGGEHLN